MIKYGFYTRIIKVLLIQIPRDHSNNLNTLVYQIKAIRVLNNTLNFIELKQLLYIDNIFKKISIDYNKSFKVKKRENRAEAFFYDKTFYVQQSGPYCLESP